jgi:hypothetical protein
MIRAPSSSKEIIHDLLFLEKRIRLFLLAFSQPLPYVSGRLHIRRVAAK